MVQCPWQHGTQVWDWDLAGTRIGVIQLIIILHTGSAHDKMNSLSTSADKHSTHLIIMELESCCLNLVPNEEHMLEFMIL